MIEVENISKTYSRGARGTVAALKMISFQIASGEFVAVRGASGSGKSTLLNILGCLEPPSSGRYHLDGEDVAKLADQQLARIRNAKIGFVFQSFNLLPRTTALENVEIPMVYRDGRIDRHRALSSLERVGLTARAQHFATELSGGEQQRVAIARALINNPALILADEPTGNLDLNAGREIMRLLEELHNEGRTILMVTHDDAVAAYASREILLQDGEMISDRQRSNKPLHASVEGDT
ncbi:MAG TPA: ABC transporter ATP-binding protein [Candidatus Acidoferrum sp.]|nr:ABC transporter ATP-binding protein [Candidatus Acidoferrum sp.]